MSGFLDNINVITLAHIIGQRREYFSYHFNIDLKEKNEKQLIEISREIFKRAGYQEAPYRQVKVTKQISSKMVALSSSPDYIPEKAPAKKHSAHFKELKFGPIHEQEEVDSSGT